MMLVAGLVVLSLLLGTLYLSAKIAQDVRGDRLAWAATGGMALLGVIGTLITLAYFVLAIVPQL